MTAVLLLTQPMPVRPFADAIRAAQPGWRVLEGLPVDAGDDAPLRGVRGVLAWRLPPGVAPRLPDLALVGSMGAGAEKVLPADLPAGVVVTRTVDPEVNVGLAQYVTMMALRHARELPRWERQQRARDWTRSPIAAARHRVVVLGLGETGRAIAAALQAVGLRVHGWSRRPRPGLPFPAWAGEAALPSALAVADILVCALPLTPQTEGLLDAARLACLPHGACLINVARGGHVVEDDLRAALASGRLAAAVLDVQRREPLPADNPLWDAPGVTLTPHIAGQASTEAVAGQFIDAMLALSAGHPVPRSVDRALGY